MLTIRKRGRYYHCRGTVRVGKKVRYVQEHSTGFGERAAAETYKARLEYETQQELLYGLAGRKKQLTFADAGGIYLNRSGGLHRMDPGAGLIAYSWRIRPFSNGRLSWLSRHLWRFLCPDTTPRAFYPSWLRPSPREGRRLTA